MSTSELEHIPNHFRMVPTVSGVELSFRNLNLAAGEKQILKDVSGYALPGHLLAIMGPSGSGKTTLLNVLAGRGVGTVSGDILMNNSTLSKKLKRKIAFVLQEDILFENLTLRETLLYTARLRLPSKIPYADKVKKVEEIVDTLDIRKCLDTRIGNYRNRGLSGGEKKRANIGSELLNDPAVLLLDEPTSGLDSTTACSLIEVLKRYASHSRKTVVTSIHQPSSQIFYQFDHLILLSEGEVVYFGEARGVMDYFTSISLHCHIPHYNAADFILDKVKGSEGELTIIHEAAGRQAWKSFHHTELSPQASNQLNQMISNKTHSHLAGKLRQISTFLTQGKKREVSKDNNANTNTEDNGAYTNTEFIALDMVEEHEEDSSIEMGEDKSINTSNGVDMKQETADKISQPEEPITQKCTCNLGKSGDENELPWCEVCVASASSSKKRQNLVDMDLDKRWPTTWFDQYQVLTARAFKQSRSLLLTKIDLIRHGIMSIIVGLFYFQLPRTEERVYDIRGAWFFVMVNWGIPTIMGVTVLFPSERTVINKERSAGSYHLSAYYLAKMTSEIPLLLVFPTLHLTVWYWMAGVNTFFGAFCTQWLIQMANILVAQSIGLAISASASDFSLLSTMANVYLIPALMLGGFYIETYPIWCGWVRYLSHFYYIYNLHLRVEFNMLGEPVRCLEDRSIYKECSLGNATHADGNAVLDSIGVLELPVWASVVAILSFIVFYRLLAYFLLKYKYKPK